MVTVRQYELLALYGRQLYCRFVNMCIYDNELVRLSLID